MRCNIPMGRRQAGSGRRVKKFPGCGMHAAARIVSAGRDFTRQSCSHRANQGPFPKLRKTSHARGKVKLLDCLAALPSNGCRGDATKKNEVRRPSHFVVFLSDVAWKY